jgi:KDO2-lipid IV(A) lauroyltransferase
LNNRYFDKWLRKVRAKFGATLISTKDTIEVMVRNKSNGQLANYGILSDQSPMANRARYWAPFMGIEVPMHVGAEALCKRLDLPAVYLSVEKTGRGFYRGSFVVLAERPGEIPDFGITDAFFRELEKSIGRAPEYYFWTHKRWKHREKAPKKDNI